MKSLKNMLLHGIYLGLYGFVKYLSFPFFNRLRYMVLHLFSPQIKATYIMDGVTIWFPWRVRMGKRSSLNQGVIIDGFGGVTIGNGVRIASYTIINTADHDFTNQNLPISEAGYICSPVVIEDDVWIGTHVCINKGVTIGKGAIIGAGSVVTSDIPANTIAAGIPARTIRSKFSKNSDEG